MSAAGLNYLTRITGCCKRPLGADMFEIISAAYDLAHRYCVFIETAREITVMPFKKINGTRIHYTETGSGPQSIVFSQAGHSSTTEEPAAINQALVEFLDSTSESMDN